MLYNSRKIQNNAPCLFMEFDEQRNRYEITAPAVDCTMKCAGCGWNPIERERRFKDGVVILAPNGTRQLVFPSRVIADA